MKHKKKIIILAIISLLVPGFLPHGFININKTVVNNLSSHAELCCCGNVASSCSDCCCSEDHVETENRGKYTVTINACGGTSTDIITVSKLNYFNSVSAVINYIPVASLAETTSLQWVDILIKLPYKPPKLQLLTNLT